MSENGASTSTTEGLWVFGSTILHECAAVVTFKCADYIWCIIPFMKTFLNNLFLHNLSCILFKQVNCFLSHFGTALEQT